MSFIPSNQQTQAIHSVKAWYGNPRRSPIYRLFGPAGSGKTALAEYIIAELGLRRVCAACFTGKAALVLSRRGFPQARTIHSLIYSPVEKGKGRVLELRAKLEQLIKEGGSDELIERLRREIENELAGLRAPAWNLKLDSDLIGADLLVVDEVSMCDNLIANDLLSFGVPILALGDPYQLPPIGDGGFFTNCEPDFLLTEIHRQARDSAIIRMATMAREAGVVPLGEYPDPSGEPSIVTNRADPEMLLKADQIIVGTNRMRHRVNGWIRRQRGLDTHGPLPVIGDRLVCLRNDNELGIMNGSTYDSIADWEDIDERECLIRVQSLDFPEMAPIECAAHKRLFHGEIKEMEPWQVREAQCFDHAGALTCHKMQGSQAPRIALYADWGRRDSWKQWLYTALTRASSHNYVVMSS